VSTPLDLPPILPMPASIRFVPHNAALYQVRGRGPDRTTLDSGSFPATNQAPTNQATTDQATTDQATTDQVPTDQVPTDQAPTDQVPTDQVRFQPHVARPGSPHSKQKKLFRPKTQPISDRPRAESNAISYFRTRSENAQLPVQKQSPQPTGPRFPQRY
jgi:hypothetical protein